jgi:multiple sugar transport system substrate-binding protein
MDISDKMKSSKVASFDNFPEGLVKLYTSNGKNYAIPKDYDTIGLWYNKTLFDKAKVAYPDGTWDWNKYLDAAKKLTDTKAGIFGCEAAVDNQSGYYNFIYQNGGNVISDDKTKSGYDMPATQEALQFYADLSLKYKVSPTVQQFADTTEQAYFESGKVAMGYFGSWMVSEFKANDYVKANCDVAIIPQGKQKASIFNGLGNVVSAKTKYPEQSWKFLEYMGTKEANIIQAENGSAIPAYNGTQQPWIDYTKGFNLKVYPEMASYGIPYATSASRPKWDPVETTYITKILSGKANVADASNQLAKEMNAILATQK